MSEEDEKTGAPLLRFECAGEKPLEIRPNDPGDYVIMRGELIVAMCAEFPDAVAVFDRQRTEMVARLLRRETGR